MGRRWRVGRWIHHKSNRGLFTSHLSIQTDQHCVLCSLKVRTEERKVGREEGRKDGRKGGRKEGRKEGSKEGRMEGRQEGRKERRQ